MEPFEILIDINGDEVGLLVVPFPGEIKYNIFNGLDRICTVWPLVEGEDITWITDTDLPEDLIILIGLHIEIAINDKLGDNG
jgi:hypothetical protein